MTSADVPSIVRSAAYSAWAKPSGDLGSRTASVGSVWLGASLLLVGFWAAASRGAVGAAGVAAVLLLLAFAPPAFGLQRTSAADWIAAALGLVLGAAAYMPRARRASGP